MSKTVSITNARKDIYKIAEEVCECHEEVLVYNSNTGKNMVILSEEDWNGIKETLYLYSIPGMVDSIVEAKNAPQSEYEEYDPNEEW